MSIDNEVNNIENRENLEAQRESVEAPRGFKTENTEKPSQQSEGESGDNVDDQKSSFIVEDGAEGGDNENSSNVGLGYPLSPEDISGKASSIGDANDWGGILSEMIRENAAA